MAQLSNTISFLQKCRKQKDLTSAKHLYAQVCLSEAEDRQSIGNYVIPMFVECGSISDAQQAFNTLYYPNQHSWTSLISGYMQCGQSDRAFIMYRKMQEASIPPSDHTFTALLKGCGRGKDVDRGHQIHMEAKKLQFETNLFVGSALVDMYSKCGLLRQAQEVFDKLPIRDVVCWTALISGYTEHGSGEEALKCFEQMQQEGVSLDPFTFVCSLKACAIIGDVDRGRQIHKEVFKRGFERDVFVGSALIDMYVKCNSIVEARVIFDKLPARNVVLWNTLLAGYVENGFNQEVLTCFQLMLDDGVSPDGVTFVCSLKACGNMAILDRGQEIHAKLGQMGYEKDVIVGRALVDMYAKCRSIALAREVFDKLPFRDILTWTALIAGYVENGSGQEALNCFGLMQLEGISPDSVIYICCLKACNIILSIIKGRELHCEIVLREFKKDIFIGSTLIDMYAKCGSLVDAEVVFDKLPIQNAVSWNTLIAGYADSGCGLEALKCFEQMTIETICPNAATFVCTLKACCNIQALDKGREIHAEVLQKGYGNDHLVENTLVDMYAKCGSLVEAEDVFDAMEVRSIVSWNALIGGFSEKGPCREALKCFKQMQLEGILPNAVTFSGALKACGNIGAMDRGQEMHVVIGQQGYDKDILLGTTLLDMYAKGGSAWEARKVFDKLRFQTVVSWNAMIRAYGMNCEADMAVQCFDDMQNQDIRPDSITFICLLTACSRANLVRKGQEYFDVMRSEYGIIPTMDHHACMVDLLSRSGCLYRAAGFLQAAAYFPFEEGLTALLSACKVYGEVELGQKCFQQLVHMNPKCAASYALMANIYLTAGRWEDANKIEELRKRAGAKKKPATALIEVNKVVHEFVIGHDRSEELSAMLETLYLRLKEEGYVPNVDLILRSGCGIGKEVELCGHAEKLAIAFGLLHTPQGQTLRVSKNLRMCNDCHNATKIISKIERREILLRESNWVHHFKDGLCSCGDVW